jgi:hypothetical protein
MRAGARAEDLQDQAGAVDHLGVPRLLEIALLHGREPVVDDDQADLLLFRRLLMRSTTPLPISVAGVSRRIGTACARRTSRSMARASPTASSSLASLSRCVACRGPECTD